MSNRTPFISDLKPSGKYVMEDIHKVCGGGGCKLLEASVSVFLHQSFLKYVMEDIHKVGGGVQAGWPAENDPSDGRVWVTHRLL